METNKLEALVQASQLMAEAHAKEAMNLIAKNGLADAIEYCKNQGIDPPKCSLTAKSENAEKLRNSAQEMLSDEAWWRKRLKIKTIREYENNQRVSGNVTNIISDGLLDYMKKR